MAKKLSKEQLLEFARAVQKEVISTRANAKQSAIDASFDDFGDLDREEEPLHLHEPSDDEDIFGSSYFGDDIEDFEDDEHLDDQEAYWAKRREKQEELDPYFLDDLDIAHSDRLERKGGHVPFSEDAIGKPEVENWDEYEVNEEMKKGDFTKRAGKHCADVAKSLKKKFGKDSSSPFAIAQSMHNKGYCEEEASLEEEYIGFDKLVNKLKDQGKSEESAKAIAASIGRKKYGKEKFQKAAASGKKLRGAEPKKEESDNLEESIIRQIVRKIVKEQFSTNMMGTPNAEPVKTNGNGTDSVILKKKNKQEEELDEARVADPSKEGGVQSQMTAKKKSSTATANKTEK